MLATTMGAGPGELAAVYGFAQNFGTAKITRVIGQAWTLDVELAFYALVPLAALALAYVFRGAGERRRRRVLFAALAVCAGASLVVRGLAPSGLASAGPSRTARRQAPCVYGCAGKNSIRRMGWSRPGDTPGRRRRRGRGPSAVTPGCQVRAC